VGELANINKTKRPKSQKTISRTVIGPGTMKSIMGKKLYVYLKIDTSTIEDLCIRVRVHSDRYKRQVSPVAPEPGDLSRGQVRDWDNVSSEDMQFKVKMES